MEFEEVFIHLKNEKKAYRQGWNAVTLGKSVYIRVIYSQELEPYFIYTDEDENEESIWTPSILDLFADDWEVM